MPQVSRASGSKFRRIMSAVGTTPLQSPGCNEGKARNGTLGKHGHKKIRAPQERHYNASICLGLLGVPPLWGSIDVFYRLTQGLRPGLCRSIALTGLICVFITNQFLCCVFNVFALGSKSYLPSISIQSILLLF